MKKIKKTRGFLGVVFEFCFLGVRDVVDAVV